MKSSRWLQHLLWSSLSCFTLCGCFDSGSTEDDGKPRDVLFRNASSYNVTVVPGADDRFQRFTLPPGASNVVVKEDIVGQLNWGYGPGDRVYIENKSSGEIVFRTR
jgi:hypothetical protein